MPINEMLAALEEEGKEVCKKILSDARVQAKQVNKDAEDAAAFLEQELIEEADTKLNLERSKVFKVANFSVNKVVIEKKEEMIKSLFDKITETIKVQMQDSNSSRNILKELTNEAVSIIKSDKKELIVSVNKKDIDNAKQIFDDLNIQCRIEDNSDIISGLKIRTADGKIAVDNTIESRAQKAWQLLKPEIVDLLFGEK